MNTSTRLYQAGQSIWFDNMDRALLENGEMARMIADGEIYGVTSNPSIFEKSIGSGVAYEESLQTMSWAGLSTEQIYLQLVLDDIQAAADLFKLLYEKTQGGDGYVSLEVSPLLARNTEDTIAEAKALWAQVSRPNLMIKVPATEEGIPAIEELIAQGINVNATLIFSIAQYEKVMDAYIRGLERRLDEGLDVDRVASVASFFVSRIDSAVDFSLPSPDLRGKVAIANARLAYQAYLNKFSSERFTVLEKEGAKRQRPLWASTGTKDPAYSDVFYVDELVGQNTVSTVPPATLKALLDHGQSDLTIERDLDAAKALIDSLKEHGVDLGEITRNLESEGVVKFEDAYNSLLDTIGRKRAQYVDDLKDLAEPVRAAVKKAAEGVIVKRLFEHDPTFWTQDVNAFDEITNRLGWLGLPEKQFAFLPELTAFRKKVDELGFTNAFVLGMGGSSLAPEVMSLTLTPQAGGIDLQIIDTTNPDEILARLEGVDLTKTLVIVSSKSGGTSETNAALQYFWKLYEDLGITDIGKHFVAITDPGTSLELMAREKGFSQTFLAPADVGGRYSVFTTFGLVPGAVIGVDLQGLLEKAHMADLRSRSGEPYSNNPGLVLGIILGTAALQGRNKLTFIAEGYAKPLVPWMEQLIAESSGKEGRGILPIDAEPETSLVNYGNDRIFAYLRVDDKELNRIAAIKAAGFPVVEISLDEALDLGREFYKWEYATAIACSMLDVNAFDQPNVQENKTITKEKTQEYQSLGHLVNGEVIWENDQAVVYGVKIGGLESAVTIGEVVTLYAKSVEPGGYIGLNAYLPRTETVEAQLQQLRAALLETGKVPVTLGFGPRFLHSTGQLHKGGFPGGVFFILTEDPKQDVPIPGEGMSFATMQQAQAIGDLEALTRNHRRAIRIHLKQANIGDLH